MWPFSSNTPESASLSTSTTFTQPSLPSVHSPTPEAELDALPSITGHANSRLSIPFPLRLPLLLCTSFSTGFFLGALHGGPLAADRYRALNAHRLPTTQTGWYLYHKSKNYHSILGGVRSGVRLGGVLIGWTGFFCVCEEIIDQSRTRAFGGEETMREGQRDVLSTVIAALSTAGVYSWKRRLDYFTAARTARLALKWGVVYGLVQDGLAVVRGERVGYVDWIVKRVRGRREMEGPV